MGLHALIGRALEEGRLQGPVARAAGVLWGRVASRAVVRRLVLPRSVRVVAVGGATLGGSGKTPLALACAHELAAMGARVALVGHAYRARPGRPRRVLPDDPLAEVGDEALVAARALGPRVPVMVAPTRALALAAAARLADVLVLDGVLQTAPERAALALLAVDEDEPWGSARAVPPGGDLRAPVAALCAAADRVVAIGETVPDARIRSLGAWLQGALLPWEELRTRRIGLACALGRPDRVLRFLARRGVVPVAVARGSDHGTLPTLDAAGVDLWLATAKCATHVRPAGGGTVSSVGRVREVATIDHALVLSAALLRTLALVARLDPASAQQ